MPKVILNNIEIKKTCRGKKDIDTNLEHSFKFVGELATTFGFQL